MKCVVKTQQVSNHLNAVLMFEKLGELGCKVKNNRSQYFCIFGIYLGGAVFQGVSRFIRILLNQNVIFIQYRSTFKKMVSKGHAFSFVDVIYAEHCSRTFGKGL